MCCLALPVYWGLTLKITTSNENKIETLENNDGVASELSALQADCPAASLQPEDFFAFK